LRIEGTHLTREPEGEPSEQGFGDTVFGIKYRLLDERPNFPAVLAGLTLRLPTGDDERGLGEEEFDVGGLVAVSKTFGPLAAILNAGYTFATLGRTFDAWTVNAALEYRVTAAWSLVAEVVQEFPNSDDPHTVVVRGGTVYAVTDRIKLDAGVGVGATRASPDVVVTAGITISF
jgi:hypothetical protein